MEFPVEATVLVDHFQDQLEVRRLLRSHGFREQGLGRGQIQIQGDFEHLRVLKVRLEQLLASEANGDEGAASSSSPTHQDHRPPSGGEWTMVDSDVFRYARQLGNKELQNLLSHPDLQTRTSEDGLSTGIRFLGSGIPMGPLQDRLDHLNTSLRTHEVPLRDLDQQGWVLLRRIQDNRNISESVLVCELEDRVHLVGPSRDSWELKQRLLGKHLHQSGARGRRDGSRWRSSSMGPAAGFSWSGPDPGRPPRTQSLSRTAGSGPDPDKPQRTQRLLQSWDTGRPKQQRQKEKRSCSVL